MTMNFLEAVARMEGFYQVGSRPQRNNNPGDIEFGHFAQAHGATHGDPRFAVFPNAASGFSAMKALLQAPSYSDLTVEQAINRYAPSIENATNTYITSVCTWVGCQPTSLVKDLL